MMLVVAAVVVALLLALASLMPTDWNGNVLMEERINSQEIKMIVLPDEHGSNGKMITELSLGAAFC
ncbi:hypothetical protein DTL42_17245 [Bremerella cremea]|uniref:Uncharacterized protein n=1 Tax=Bremerella cremea TaxID=1031537 RepID=A0A368KN51_9BACT|nr:hypothetical protein [Bremerella cremea]RCS44668.1 hypothetical protein DTL42_17245 [Bremerella cremea]